MDKKKLLVSFSGGETSAYMAQWLWINKRDEFDMIFVFANTGQENIETLQFVYHCSVHFGFPVVLVEAAVNPFSGKGTRHRVIPFKNLSMDGQPFEEVIRKFGIPNAATPHCTRELKERPITDYARSLGWKKWHTAIGIRIDEIDRVSPNRAKRRLIYPLVEMRPMTKQKINFWWSQQPFRLQLKGYQGNCITCWKKSDRKLYQIAKENPLHFSFFGKMELRYSDHIPESRLKLLSARGEYPKTPITFFRKHRSAIDICKEAEGFNGTVIDDSRVYDEQLDFEFDGGSCEVFTKCR
jgi:3'-phosphoadenosine 5'-phosphosulfate sulfotransferase (PAPS reductase)/FAD synthetase